MAQRTAAWLRLVLPALVCVLAASLLAVSAARTASADDGSAEPWAADLLYTGPQPDPTGPMTADDLKREQLMLEFVESNRDLPAEDMQRQLNQRYGLLLVSQPVPTTATTSSDGPSRWGETKPGAVGVPRPDVFYSPESRRWHVMARFNWLGESWYQDFDWCCWADFRDDVGGYDGFGVRYSRQLYNERVYGHMACGNGSAFNCRDIALATNSAHGVTMRAQDIGAILANGSEDYSWEHGVITVRLNEGGSCGRRVQLNSAYFHSWSGTALTGLGVGPFSFSASWSGSDENWSHASQGSVWKRRC